MSSLPLPCDCYRPSTLTEGSAQKKKKAKKVNFYLQHNNLKKANLDQVFSKSRSGTTTHKNKKVDYHSSEHGENLSAESEGEDKEEGEDSDGENERSPPLFARAKEGSSKMKRMIC